ncbi:MAG TPA: potassium transporter Kup [Rhodothermales bacterium]|nr:potassium transporter Kup [Rhodothermales bacterium]
MTEIQIAAAEEKRTEDPPHGKRYLALLSLTALGVVYGDIGTSPLYTVRESFHMQHGLAVNATNILGVLSLIFWALVLVISVKYIVFIIRADNHGEGGILALTALVTPVVTRHKSPRWILIMLGLFGTALLLGDGMITPAITVLSAVEGLEIATPLFQPYIIPITIVILVALFAVQHWGTAGVGRVFGPIILLWFLTIAVLGFSQIVRAPRVLEALNPYHAVIFFVNNGFRGFVVLGSVVLAVTGGEALYADLGHFGARPIRLTWFFVVLPALLLNYFGQGALLMREPSAAINPFYHMVPTWGLYPVVVLATAASVIASQALITGAFSLAMQAVQLGYSPRLEVEHTSAQEYGQIYVPALNWVLMVACVALVLGFKSSSNLAAAYGVAVTTTMVITTILFAVVAREHWRWSVPVLVIEVGIFLTIDLAFFGANLLKIPDGGWFPLAVALIAFILMSTWKTGRRILGARMSERTLPQELFLQDVAKNPPSRVPGTAVFLSGNSGVVPFALLHSLKHYNVLHEKTVFLVVETEEVPHVPIEERAEAEDLGHGMYRVVLHYGFMEGPDVPEGLKQVRMDGLDFRPMHTSYFLGRETLLITKQPGMALWRERLFALMSRNARNATAFFRLPPNRVVELGRQIEF